MTPREVIAIALKEGLDPVDYLHDYMTEKDSRVSLWWCRTMVEKYSPEIKKEMKDDQLPKMV